jgi:ribosome-associated toxin RatA of RatAB toxin-antitoxin module
MRAFMLRGAFICSALRNQVMTKWRPIGGAAQRCVFLLIVVAFSLNSFGYAGTTPAPEIRKLDTHAADGVVQVEAAVRIHANRLDVWQVLTDYDGLAEFVPGLVLSQSRGRNQLGQILLDQAGASRFLLFRVTLQTQLAVIEHRPQKIEFKQVAGDFKMYEGSWELQLDETATRLIYRLRAKPDFFAPTFLLKGRIRRNVLDGLASVAAEVYRRRRNPNQQADYPAAR